MDELTREAKYSIGRHAKWLLLIVLGIITFGTILLMNHRQGESNPAAPNPERSSPPQPKPRSTMQGTWPELVGRYNAQAQKIKDGIARIPEGPLPSTANDNWRLYQIPVYPTVAVTAEVSLHNGRPFSMGFIATPDTQDRSIMALSTMVAVGAAVLGAGEDAGALMRTCKLASDAKEKNVSVHVHGYDVYCTVVEGAWIGGISVPKD
jgi:hypothetical protein